MYNRVLITGGTGSVGSAVARMLDSAEVKTVIFSRSEIEQHRLRSQLKFAEFVIGDVRRYQSVLKAVTGCDVVIHAASMKFVDICEENVYEAVQTNIVGAQNVREACHQAGVSDVITISTDKAVNPVGVMGHTKLLQEKLFLQEFPNPTPRTAIVRFGNVLGSRGSVVNKFKEQVKAGLPLTVTSAAMLRFVMTEAQAADTVFWTLTGLRNGTIENRSIVIRQLPSTSVMWLAKAIAGTLNPDIEYIDVRPGERISESLIADGEEERTQIVNEDGKTFGVIYPATSNFRLGIEAMNEVTRRFSIYRDELSVEKMRQMLVGANLL